MPLKCLHELQFLTKDAEVLRSVRVSRIKAIFKVFQKSLLLTETAMKIVKYYCNVNHLFSM